MARKTTTVTTCDRDGCRNYGEVGDDREAPAEWYLVIPASKDQKLGHSYTRGAGSFEFCSLDCVTKWARERRVFLNGGTSHTHVSRSSTAAPSGGSEAQLGQIRAAFRTMADTEMTVAEVAGLVGYHRTTVDKLIGPLVDRGVIVLTQERRGPNGARYKLAETVA